MGEPVPDDPPRVVLFGRAGAGKSSLLGALAEAARTQGERLGAEVVDPAGSLATIRDQVYSDGTGPSQSELTPHTLRLRPWHGGAKEPTEPGPLLIVDSAGPAAEALLKEPEAVAAGTVQTPLAGAIQQADALLLAIPAAADEAELDASFEEFRTFLDAVNEHREWNRVVGGLPVSIVLTQCDRLAKPEDTAERWQKRVEERKAFVAARFQAFLEATSESSHLAFGSLDVSLFATAVRWPKLAGSDAPAEPFGIADLFRDSFTAAREHHERSAHSQRRLGWTLRGSVVLVTALVAALLGFMSRHPESGAAVLEDKIHAYRNREGDASARLAARNILRHHQVLTAFHDDASFDALPEEMREYVNLRLREVEEFQAFRAKLLTGPSPAEARTLADLDRIEARLVSLPLPEEYAWGETDAARLRAKWLADVPLIREAVRGWENWYRDLIREANGHERTASFEGDWRPGVERFLKRSGERPFKLDAPLPGSQELPFPRGEAVTYAVPFEFDRVYQAREDWDETRDRLVDLRNLADALGLTAGPDRKPALLDLPVSALNAGDWSLLQKEYPSADPSYPQWVVTRFPEPGRTELTRRIERSLDRGRAQVRKLIVAKDTPAGWKEVADRLAEPGFQAWGRMLTLLERLRNPSASDPVAELAAFLRKEQFELNLVSFDVVVPDDLLLQRAIPKGDLTVTHTLRMGESRVIRFRQIGEGQREGGFTRYSFNVVGGGAFVYRPGDKLTASLTLRGGEEELNLTWSDSRCETYAFEALTRAVRGVRLVPIPAASIPAVPVLLPALR